MAVIKDISGEKFGRLLVIRFVGKTKNGNAKWLCKCDCGGEKIVSSYSLRSGRTKSCGCIKKEQNQILCTTHGESGKHKTRLYKIWSSMKNRCYNQKDKNAYKKYGQRGITVCDEWRFSYESFGDWALNNGYSENLTIDRIDFNGPYEPQNCRWITVKEQNNNRRSNRKLTFNGQTKTVAEWSDFLGVNRSVFQHRLDRGWSVENTLQTPVKRIVNGKCVYVDIWHKVVS